MLFALCVVTAVAADINGKWVAQVPGRDGTPMEQTFMFKVAGDQVTGTLTTQQGSQEISEGKLSGNEVSFAVVIKRNEREMKSLYKGSISGNEIQFTRTRAPGAGGQGGGGGGRGGPATFIAKKAG
jgi:protein subunit release factor B